MCKGPSTEGTNEFIFPNAEGHSRDACIRSRVSLVPGQIWSALPPNTPPIFDDFAQPTEKITYDLLGLVNIQAWM